MTTKPFAETPGPNVVLPLSPIGIFGLFFTSHLLQYIVKQTNQYALECMGIENFGKWTQVTVEELQAYMGFMILMEIVHLPSIYDYWKKDEVYHYSPVASRITRDRFFELYRYLHFADNSSLGLPGIQNMTSWEKSSPSLKSFLKGFIPFTLLK